jgi:hypothetical protein
VALVGFDRDDAGEAGADAFMVELREAGASAVDRWRPPAGSKDWAEAWAARAAGSEAP